MVARSLRIEFRSLDDNFGSVFSCFVNNPREGILFLISKKPCLNLTGKPGNSLKHQV